MGGSPHPMQKQLWAVETDEGIGWSVTSRQSIAGSPLLWHHCMGADPSSSHKTSLPSPGRFFPFPSLLEGWANVHLLSSGFLLSLLPFALGTAQGIGTVLCCLSRRLFNPVSLVSHGSSPCLLVQSLPLDCWQPCFQTQLAVFPGVAGLIGSSRNGHGSPLLGPKCNHLLHL